MAVKLYPSRQHKEAVYKAMLEHIDCGPFDGGCVAFALALQQVLGGEVQVITGRLRWHPSYSECSTGAQHAVLKLPDGRLIDGDGIGSAKSVVARFVREELGPPATFEFTGLRELQADDLPNAPRDAALIEELTQLFSHLEPIHDDLNSTIRTTHGARPSAP